MRLGRLWLLLAGGWAGFAASGQAQTRSALGPSVVLLGSDPTGIGLLPRFRWAVARELGMAVGAGLVRRAGGAWAGRGELTLQLRLGAWSGAPKPVWYASGGIAGMTGSQAEAVLMAGAGVELPRGKSGGWWGEVGVAGGIRLAGGYHVTIGGRKR